MRIREIPLLERHDLLAGERRKRRVVDWKSSSRCVGHGSKHHYRQMISIERTWISWASLFHGNSIDWSTKARTILSQTQLASRWVHKPRLRASSRHRAYQSSLISTVWLLLSQFNCLPCADVCWLQRLNWNPSPPTSWTLLLDSIANLRAMQSWKGRERNNVATFFMIMERSKNSWG